MTAPVNTIADIPEADYFAAVHALSASGAKLLLPPNCPARFRWAQDHPVHKDVFDFGSAAHKVVLHAGPPVQVIDAAYFAMLADHYSDDPKVVKMFADAAKGDEVTEWRTSAAKAARAHARGQGHIPLLRADYDRVLDMGAALLAHPLAAALFDPDHGLPERSLFWDDADTGVPCRARLDWLPDPRGGRLTIGDYKTTAGEAHPDLLAKAAGNYGYHIQHAHYVNGAAALGLDDDPAFVFVFQEKTPPYLVNVVQLDAAAIRTGREAMRAATEIFRDCTAADSWPGYPMDIPEIPLPPWKARIPEGFYS